MKIVETLIFLGFVNSHSTPRRFNYVVICAIAKLQPRYF
jgi:hypothetical protein